MTTRWLENFGPDLISATVGHEDVVGPVASALTDYNRGLGFTCRGLRPCRSRGGCIGLGVQDLAATQVALDLLKDGTARTGRRTASARDLRPWTTAETDGFLLRGATGNGVSRYGPVEHQVITVGRPPFSLGRRTIRCVRVYSLPPIKAAPRPRA
jgi:hypothetical protein